MSSMQTEKNNPTIGDVLIAINVFSNRMDERFEKVESRLDKVESKLDNIEGELRELNSRMKYLEERVNSLEKRMEASEKQIDRYFSVEKDDVIAVVKDLESLKKKVARLEIKIQRFQANT